MRQVSQWRADGRGRPGEQSLEMGDLILVTWCGIADQNNYLLLICQTRYTMFKVHDSIR